MAAATVEIELSYGEQWPQFIAELKAISGNAAEERAVLQKWIRDHGDEPALIYAAGGKVAGAIPFKEVAALELNS